LLLSYGSSLTSKSATSNSWLGFVYFCVGLVLWTLIEYLLHRFILHAKQLPYSPFMEMAFILHGMHHKTPFDRGRLVFPPFPASIIFGFVFGLYRTFLSLPVTCLVLSGTVIGYVCYDLIHFYLHHGRPSLSYWKQLKKYHYEHHFKDWNTGFGISSKLWDWPFGTLNS